MRRSRRRFSTSMTPPAEWSKKQLAQYASSRLLVQAKIYARKYGVYLAEAQKSGSKRVPFSPSAIVSSSLPHTAATRWPGNGERGVGVDRHRGRRPGEIRHARRSPSRTGSRRIKQCDRIFMLHRGQVVEEGGNHDELVRRRGRYTIEWR